MMYLKDENSIYPSVAGAGAGEATAKAALQTDDADFVLVYALKDSFLLFSDHKSFLISAGNCYAASSKSGGLHIEINAVCDGAKYAYVAVRNARHIIAPEKLHQSLGSLFSPDPAGNLSSYILHIVSTYQSLDIYQSAAMSYSLLMELCSAAQNASGQAYPQLVQDAMGIIHARYPFLSGIDELSDMLGISEPHFIRTFTAFTGISPGKYLTKVRIERSMLLFCDPSLTVDNIANMVGFSDANYFCRVFRKSTGSTPGIFRKNHMQPIVITENKTSIALQYPYL